MKTERLVLVVLLFLFETAIAQNGWFWQYPKPQGNTLRDIFIFDQNTAIAVGDVGTIIKTNDGGMHWDVQHHAGGTSYDLYSVHFVDDLNGWAAGGIWFEEKNALIKTSDGGKTWTKVETETDLPFNAVHFVNADTGFVVGEDGIVLRTSDGGNSWDTRKIDNYIGYYLDVFRLLAVTFTDEQTGWIVGAGYYGNQIYKTTDCGRTWQWNEWIINPKIYNGLWDICFVDKKNGFIIGDNSDFLKTTDGGMIWQHQIPSDKYQFYSVFFTDSTTGWIVGGDYYGFILKTSDGGQTWVEQDYNIVGHLYKIRFSDKNNGWIVGQFGMIYRTTDGGNTWVAQKDEKFDFRSTYFVDENNGWGVGERGIIFHTEDGGSNWYKQNQSDSLLLASVYATDDRNVFTVGALLTGVPPEPAFYKDGVILRSTDGGQTWERKTYNKLSWSSSITFVNDSIGWITGDKGTLLKTMDRGNTWHKIALDISLANATLGRIQFIDKNVGWIGGILKTIDGGGSWKAQTIPLSFLNSFYFINADVGWAVGTYDGEKNIVKTTDGGSSWTPCGTTSPGYNFSIHFVNETKGWISGYEYLTQKSIIINTTDGGNSWNDQKSPAANLISIYFINENIGWAVGDGILKTTTGGVVSVEQKEEFGNKIPQQMKLFQNYPNPFNSSTIFHYRLSKSGFVSLKVYDLLGRSVSTVVEKWLPEGDYEVNWTANGLPSGLYFCRLRVGEFSETRKTILIR